MSLDKGPAFLSASSALNAAIQAKKEAEARRKKEEELERQRRINEHKSADVAAAGWWNSSDAADANSDTSPKEPVPSLKVLTGQTGIGQSMFSNIKRNEVDTPPPSASPVETITAAPAVSALTDAIHNLEVSAPAEVVAEVIKVTDNAVLPPSNDTTKAGWWSQVRCTVKVRLSCTTLNRFICQNDPGGARNLLKWNFEVPKGIPLVRFSFVDLLIQDD